MLPKALSIKKNWFGLSSKLETFAFQKTLVREWKDKTQIEKKYLQRIDLYLGLIFGIHKKLVFRIYKELVFGIYKELPKTQ